MATVTTQEEFKSAINAHDPNITVANDITLTSITYIQYAVTIKGAEGVSLFSAITAGTTRDMLSINAIGDLTIESIILDAQGRDNTLVQINGGNFTMKDGSVLKGVTSTTGRRAVYVGDSQSTMGGTFNMDGGLVTENNIPSVVDCYAGTVIMNNDASISNNNGTGITISRHFNQPYVRGTLIMKGNSTVSGNTGTQPPGGVFIFGSDFIMGESENDAPRITGNNNPYFAGGLYCDDDSTFTMGYNAEISDNHAQMFAGGAAIEDTIVHISGNATIKNNKAETVAGGILFSSEHYECSVIIEENAEISGNESGDRGGGIYIQESATLQIKGNTSIFGNKALNGGGIHLNNVGTVIIGGENSSPSILDNEALDYGGGIYISGRSSLDLTGQASISGNTAIEGRGIYKVGELNLSRAPKVTDGLFFDDLSFTAGGASNESDAPISEAPDFTFVIGEGSGRIYEEDGAQNARPDASAAQINGTIVKPIKIERDSVAYSDLFAAAFDENYCDNVPTIVDALTDAVIQLETSGYVSPSNVRVVIAEGGENYRRLNESDRAAWLIPPEFEQGHCVILNDDLNWALIALETYTISYYHLFGCDNPNPTEYDISTEFPIVLNDPSEREGYEFAGWSDGVGNIVTEITEDTIGNLVLIALWNVEKKLCVEFEDNAPCVSNTPSPIYVEYGEEAVIPDVIPKKPYHCFMGWSVSPFGMEADYLPGNHIFSLREDIKLYALWMPICDRQDLRDRTSRYCPRKKKC